MSHALLEPAELRSRGFDALVDCLGWVNAVRFLQQYETSRLDYTAERAEVLPPWQADELVRQLGRLADGGPSRRGETRDR
jgi:hypothetical protein